MQSQHYFGLVLLFLNVSIGGLALYQHANDEPESRAKKQAPIAVQELKRLSPECCHYVFHTAVSKGDVEQVINCLKAGSTDDRAHKDGSLLELAAVEGHADVCRVLIAAGANLQRVSGTFLYKLALQGKRDVLSVLQKAGVSCFCPEGYGRGRHVLSHAAMEKSHAGINVLLAAGFKPDVQPEHEELASAILSGDEEKVRSLLTPQNASLLDGYGESYLMQALYLGYTGIACAMIQAGADTEVYCHRVGFSPMYYAASHGYKDVVKALLTAGAGPHSSLLGGNTALGEAIANGHDDIAYMLLEAGADFESPGGDHGLTPLMYAIGEGNRRMFDKLLAMGADVNGAAYDGFNALMIASRDNSLDMARVLVEKGADVNIMAEAFCYTPILIAVMNDSVDCVRYLIECGANVHGTDYDGNPLLKISENETIRQLLLDAGAQWEYPDREEEE